jgi:hypothetical protein
VDECSLLINGLHEQSKRSSRHCDGYNSA